MSEAVCREVSVEFAPSRVGVVVEGCRSVAWNARLLVVFTGDARTAIERFEGVLASNLVFKITWNDAFLTTEHLEMALQPLLGTVTVGFSAEHPTCE